MINSLVSAFADFRNDFSNWQQFNSMMKSGRLDKVCKEMLY